jgi:hypothetical protein
LYDHDTETIVVVANAVRYFNYASGEPITIKRFTQYADGGFTQPGNHTAIQPYLAVVYIIKK